MHYGNCAVLHHGLGSLYGGFGMRVGSAGDVLSGQGNQLSCLLQSRLFCFVGFGQRLSGACAGHASCPWALRLSFPLV